MSDVKNPLGLTQGLPGSEETRPPLIEYVDSGNYTYAALRGKYEGKRYKHFKGSEYDVVGIAFDSMTDRWVLVLVKSHSSYVGDGQVACFRTPENFEANHESGPKRFTLVT